MKKLNIAFVLILFCSLMPVKAKPLSHEGEWECLAFMYAHNLFGDEKQKRPTTGGWSVPTPGDAVTPFEPGDYVPKLNRIQAAAEAGNIHAHAILGEMHARGICGQPRDEELAEEHFDRGRAYWPLSQLILQGGFRQPREAIKDAYLVLKVALLRYPYVDDRDARRFFTDRGNANPTEQEIKTFISGLQPPKEELKKLLHGLLEQKILEPLTQAEIHELDNRAQGWIEKRP